LEIIEAAALNASGGAGDVFGVTQPGHPDPAP